MTVRKKFARVKVAVAAAAALLLSACGFHPLYATQGQDSGAGRIFSSVYVEPISGDAGYEMRNSLINLLSASDRVTDWRYRLTVTLHDELEGSALQNDASITRYNYTLTADYTLTDAKTATVIKKGKDSSLTAYNVVQSPYATLIAQKDAQRRAGDEIAERIRLDLGVFFANPAK
ncbi:MAG TPA: LPS assembly lipoprotein LptE [Rhizomicrobium sp.]|jgi:LPS-assembly lipoprotein